MPSFFSKALLSVGAAATLVHADYTYKLMGQKAVVKDVDASQSSECPAAGGAHLIVARASTEPPGYGIIGAVKDQVLSRVPGSTAEAVDYPATLTAYVQSESDGVVAMKALLDSYITSCPGAPVVLLGYSQGAQVVADTLAGQDDTGFPTNASIASPEPDSTLARVAAGIMMGDPTFVPAESFHVGNATNHGLFPRQNVANFEATGLAGRLQSYCNAGDPYCAGGNFSTLLVHLQYVTLYGNDAADFVVDGIAKWYAANGGSSSGGAATTSCSTAPLTTPSAATQTWTTVRPAHPSGSVSRMSAASSPAASSYGSGVPKPATTTPAAATPTATPPPASKGDASKHGLSALALVGAVAAAALF